MENPRPDTPAASRQPPGTRPPVLRSYDRGKWTRIPKARRTIAELTEFVKNLLQRTNFPLLRAWEMVCTWLRAKYIYADQITTECLSLDEYSSILLYHDDEYNMTTFIYPGYSSYDHPEYGTFGAVTIDGNYNGDSVPGALYLVDGPLLHSNLIALQLKNNVAQITDIDTEDIILKATRVGDHDFKLETDRGGKLVPMGKGHPDGAKVRISFPYFSVDHETDTIVQFNKEFYDHTGMHHNVTNNSRFTCLTAGVYLVTAHATFDGVSPWVKTGYRRMRIMKKDIATAGYAPMATTYEQPKINVPTAMNLCDIVPLNVGDYVELEVWQNTGYHLRIDSNAWDSPSFAIQKIDG